MSRLTQLKATVIRMRYHFSTLTPSLRRTYNAGAERLLKSLWWIVDGLGLRSRDPQAWWLGGAGEFSPE